MFRCYAVYMAVRSWGNSDSVDMITIITNLEKLRMKNLVIQRSEYSDCSTGRMWYGDFQCFTLELPWKDNKKSISCIPKGWYKGYKIKSPSNGDCIAFLDVVGRTHIQIHSANFTRQIQGCIAVGDSLKFLDEDTIPDVTNSRETMRKLLAALPDKFTIEIR